MPGKSSRTGASCTADHTQAGTFCCSVVMRQAWRDPAPLPSVKNDILRYFSAMHRVMALVHPPQSTFELGCVAEVFGIDRPGIPTRYTFGVCAEHPGPVTTRAGYAMLVADGLDALDRADTVVVPGWLPIDEAPSPALVHA